MMFRVYITDVSETVTDSPRVARMAYAELLARDDLIGQSCAAVMERDGSTLYDSRFDADLSGGRIHPEAPIDVYALPAAAAQAAAWRPHVC